MANTVNTQINIKAVVNEFLTGEMRTTKSPITWPTVTEFSYPSGTSASQADLVWSDTGSAAGSAVSIDLSGSLTSPVNNQSVIFAEICFVGVYVVTTTSGYTLSVGGGSTPLAIFANASDITPVGPGSVFIWSNWVDGVTVGAGTTDLLQLDPGSDTIAYDILLIGRSA